jgi:putative ATP-binding cassette transporter
MEKTGMARTLSVFTQDLDTLVVFFVSLPNLFIYGAMIAGCLIYLGMLSMTVFALALAAIILGSVGYQIAHGRALGLLRRSRQREDTLMQQCKTLFDGGREYRLNARRLRQFVDGELADNIETVRKERTHGYVLYGLATNWGSVLFFVYRHRHLRAARAAGAGIHRYHRLHHGVFVHDCPGRRVLSALPAIASARIALQRVQQLSGELEPEAPQNAEKASVFSSLSLTEVRYQYEGSDGERFTLGPLSLHFRPGELVFLVGGNGSGKTTFANLLVGLYPPDSGEISLNGEPIGPDRQEMYRQQFSVVFSDFFLFGDVAFASARTPQEVDKLLRLLRLDHKVSFRDGRFSTTSLSQGNVSGWRCSRPGLSSVPFTSLMSGLRIRILNSKRFFTVNCCLR